MTGAAAALETDSSEHGQVINTQQIVELPLNGRNYADLALLSTNVIKSPMAVSFSPSGTPREGAFNVNGMRSTYNNFLLDGLDNNMYGTSNQGYSAQTVQPSPDAIAEFKVITTNYSAEYGRVGGAVVNAVMKSGTNVVSRNGLRISAQHGSECGRLSIHPAVVQADATAQSVWSHDRRTDHQEQAVLLRRLRRLPPVAELSQLRFDPDRDGSPGDSSGDRGGSDHAKSLSRGHADSHRAIESVRSLCAEQPAATNAGGTSRANNDEALLLIRDYSDKFDAKIDDQINDKMSLFLRFSQRKDLQYYAPDLTGAVRRRRQRLHPHHRSERFDRLHLDA